MYLRGILVKDDTKEINIKIDGNETIADLRRKIANVVQSEYPLL